LIQERYRADYPGEFVVLKTRLENGQKVQEREWIPNPVENQHISSRAAVVIGTIVSKDIKNHILSDTRVGIWEK